MVLWAVHVRATGCAPGARPTLPSLFVRWKRLRRHLSISALRMAVRSCLPWHARWADGLRVDGEVHGDSTAEGGASSLVVISKNARVYGKVKAAHVIISSKVFGPVYLGELLELQPKARVTGSVRCEFLEMHPGALAHGWLKPLKSSDKPTLKLAASNEA